jgi:hypothetical protein
MPTTFSTDETDKQKTSMKPVQTLRLGVLLYVAFRSAVECHIESKAGTEKEVEINYKLRDMVVY